MAKRKPKIPKQRLEGGSMKINKGTMDFIVTFTVVFVVSMIIAFLYNLIVYKTSIVDGEMSLRLALTLGISLGIIKRLKKK